MALAEDVPTVVRLEDRLEVGTLQVIGEAELAELPQLDALWRARIDSGATTTSLHATDISEFERDGQRWVRFVARNDQLKRAQEAEYPLVRYAEIKRRGGAEVQRRPVVALNLRIGDVEREIEVNLTDRTDFDYPVLIGRNFLSGVTLIDVSRSYLHGAEEDER